MAETFQYRILVLNRLWQPVNIVGVPRAFSLLTQDHAQVINTDDEAYQMMNLDEWLEHSALTGEDAPSGASIQTVNFSIRVPKVLLLRRYDQLPAQEVKFTRDTVFERDDHRCQYCGDTFDTSDLNLDHVIPRDQGGKTSWENIVTSCIRCNSRKANRLPHQAQMHLLRKPTRPKWRPFVSSLIGQEYDPAWRHFINVKQTA